ncbi:RHS repeat-associated core domain-containing protein [Streptosporangium sp. NBC_01469]|uniref:RHS repeat-associated core domain-containing protein n=1 Tax=Streptosporangium sp. NBC_01469 TaxID=2903898 RepID=UPI002E2820FF|nr:RHS repeat-associated core domain-containing protein [Streptosporangium sp. NBC_01469]
MTQTPAAGHTRRLLYAGRTRTARLIAMVVTGVMVSSVLQVPPATAQVPDFTIRPVQKEKSVGGGTVAKDAATPPSDSDRRPWKAPAPVAWPTGAAELGPRRAAGNLPVRLARGPAKVRVEVADRAAAQRAGVDGLLLTLRRADGESGAERSAVEVGYGTLKGAFGADWASRLTLVQLPECALTTPERDECRTGRPLITKNDTAAGTLAAEVDVAGATVLAAAAAPAGSSGTYTATSLSPSGEWSGGGNSGSFGYGYDIDVPPSPGELDPDVSLSYSSVSVDGRTAATNNQPSWVGEGWDYDPGYIERNYVACKDDRGEGSNSPDKVGDLCWKSDNATLSMDGASTALVRDDATGRWRLADDDGSRVEHLNGTSSDTANGDNDNEYWRITKTDGTQYWFGKNRLPGWSTGKPETGSGRAVPVAGNHSGDPCRASAYADSFCNQMWRWQLDYVVDPQGNAMAYYYTKETGAYAKNKASTATASYTRGGYLNRIEYGLRSGQVYATAPAKVVFGVSERCLSACTTFDVAHAANWPDTPVDQNCTVDKTCKTIAPTFWSRKRLTSITTQVLKGTAYADVDSWALAQQFPGSGDASSAALWLSSVTHTGKAAGTAITLPAVTFGGTLMENRVDAAEGRPPLNKYRLTRISSESGADTLVTYSAKECTYGATPQPDTNTKRCFPAFWSPEGYIDPIKDWFHKYVVTKVVEDDKVAGSGSESKVTSYEYLGGAAWRRDDSEFTLDKHRTWNMFRGYGQVRTKEGEQNRTQSDTIYYRGMDGDKLADGSVRNVTVADSEGAKVDDADVLAGTSRELVTYTGENGQIATASVSDPWLSAVTATRARPGLPALTARMQDVAKVRARTLITTASGTAWRRTQVDSSYNGDGLVTQVGDQGDLSVTGDEECRRTTYATRDTTNWLVGYPASTLTTSATCQTPASAANTVGEERLYYDKQALGAAPAVGRAGVTRTEKLWKYDEGRPVHTETTQEYDAYGRGVSSVDELGRPTTTTYSPATGAFPTAKTVTNVKGHATTITLDGTRGLVLSEKDLNGRMSYTDHDALGRLTAVWMGGRAKTASASMTFSYAPSTTVPTAVTKKDLLENGTYKTTITLYDGLLRQRQTQVAAPTGGRVVQDNFYDSHGRVWKTNDVYWNSAAPTATLLSVADNLVPTQTETVFDGQDRTVAEIYKSLNVAKWRTDTVHGGNYTAITPPEGDTATLTVLDSEGRTTELRQYRDREPVFDAPASAYEATKYTYDPAGRLDTVVDPAGNTWTYDYDVRGDQVQTTDPDKGLTKFTYDAAGNLETSTDARKVTLTYVYDDLDRKVSLSQGATKRAEWSYDTLPGGKGLPVTDTRWENGNAYTTSVKGYDAVGRGTGTTVTIPAAEGALAGTYTTGTTYRPVTGTVATTSYPAVGGLPAETLSHGYDTFGNPASLNNGSQVYANGTQYSPYGEVLQTVLGTVGSRVVHTLVYEDVTRRLAQVLNDREKTGPQTMDNVVYSYDAAGNIVKVRNDRDDKTRTDTQCYRYDHLRRLTKAWTALDDCAGDPSTATVGGPEPYWQSFGFDAVGNRTSETRHAVGGGTGDTGDTVRTYTYPAPGQVRPHTLSQVASTGPGARTDSYEYDDTGNTTRRVTALGDQGMTWDAEGRLGTSTVGGKETSFVYDADGERLLRRDPDAVTLYLGGQELKLTRATAKVDGTRYYEVPEATVVRTTGGGVSYVLADHHDTGELSVNATTLAYVRRSTTPYGAVRGTDPASWPGERGFVGGTIDKTMGLTKLGAREYDADTGRFVSADPVMDLTDPQQINGYAYASNNPVTWHDASGERVCNDTECANEGIRPDGQPAKKPKKAKKPGKKGKSKSSGSSGSSSGTRSGPQMSAANCTTQQCYLRLYEEQARRYQEEINRINAEKLRQAREIERLERQKEASAQKTKKKKPWWRKSLDFTGEILMKGSLLGVVVGCGVSIVCGLVAGTAIGLAGYTMVNAGQDTWNWADFGKVGAKGAFSGGMGRAYQGARDAYKTARGVAAVRLTRGTPNLPAVTPRTDFIWGAKFLNKYHWQWKLKPIKFSPDMTKAPYNLPRP